MDKDYVIYKQMYDLLEDMKAAKPNDRSEADRRYAIAITDMEKQIASFKTWIVDGGLSR